MQSTESQAPISQGQGVVPRQQAMNVERLKRIESLFREAIEWDDAELESRLAERCGDDSSLRRSVLSLIERDRNLERSTYLSAPTNVSEHRIDPGQMCGRRFGAFKLVRHLGSGGMSDVFLAVRDDDFKQQAAVKLLRAGDQGEKIAKRFRKEMQFLAGLGKHPNITSIL
ncbi:MAG: hypothetical protein AAFX06_16215, partial [Planctomycetota bacterium]